MLATGEGHADRQEPKLVNLFGESRFHAVWIDGGQPAEKPWHH